mmetsp:Transcript_10712/g.16341  ORF Transcript_10712/g.16341 Transcript_10712/m.16341 type:complete len:99 (-) Transcript_10712:26-322(-)
MDPVDATVILLILMLGMEVDDDDYNYNHHHRLPSCVPCSSNSKVLQSVSRLGSWRWRPKSLPALRKWNSSTIIHDVQIPRLFEKFNETSRLNDIFRKY